jgi:hypothetical protein
LMREIFIALSGYMEFSRRFAYSIEAPVKL